VIVNKEASKHRGARRAAHGRRDKRVREEGSTFFQDGSSLGHEIQRAELNVLVVRHHQDDVGLLNSAG